MLKFFLQLELVKRQLGVGLATEKSPGSLVHLPRAGSVVPSPEYYQGTCLRPKAQARERSEVGRTACGGNLGSALRIATGVTCGTCHRPVAPEQDKGRWSTSVCAPGTAGFPTLPPYPHCGAHRRSSHWEDKTQWFMNRNKGHRPPSSSLSGVFSQPLALAGKPRRL